MLEGIGPIHLIFVLVIALIVVGPGKLPEVGGAIGKSIREFRKASAGDDTPDAPAPVAPAPAPVAAPVAQVQAPPAPVAVAPVAVAPVVAAPVAPAAAPGEAAAPAPETPLVHPTE